MTDSHSASQYQAPEKLLANKIIVVSGAGDGIGKTAALTFAKYGATIILLGRTLEKLESVYDAIESAGYPKPAIFPINLESAVEQDYRAMREALNEEFGRIDGLLHNAAELGPKTPISQYPAEKWQTLMQVNVTAPFLMTKELLPLLQNAPNGSIVFTGSSVGYKGRAYWGAYAVSKAANENMMQTLADEFDQVNKIRVNSINPGGTRTQMRAKAYPAEDPTTVPSAEEIMNTYLFLMGDESIEISGQQFDAQPK